MLLQAYRISNKITPAKAEWAVYPLELVGLHQTDADAVDAVAVLIELITVGVGPDVPEAARTCNK